MQSLSTKSWRVVMIMPNCYTRQCVVKYAFDQQAALLTPIIQAKMLNKAQISGDSGPALDLEVFLDISLEEIPVRVEWKSALTYYYRKMYSMQYSWQDTTEATTRITEDDRGLAEATEGARAAGGLRVQALLAAAIPHRRLQVLAAEQHLVLVYIFISQSNSWTYSPRCFVRSI